jgi:hypothetical protein
MGLDVKSHRVSVTPPKLALLSVVGAQAATSTTGPTPGTWHANENLKQWLMAIALCRILQKDDRNRTSLAGYAVVAWG